MHFVLIGWDAPDSREKRPHHRADHLDYWKAWEKRDRLLLAGPMTDFAGSLLIIDAESEDEALDAIADDPYTRAGVFERTEVHPFRPVLPISRYGV